MNFDAIKSIIIEWQRRLSSINGLDRAYEEEILKSIGSKPIKIISGFRRSGKSFLVQKIAARLIKKKTFSEEDILYLNFEEYHLIEVNSAEKLGRVLEIFESLQTPNNSRRKLLIFDEIQNVNNWDKFIRTIYEKNHHNQYEIIIIGSNSRLLSSELGSNLAGRFIEYHIYPFSFSELLQYHGLKIDNAKHYLREKKEILSLFEYYVNFGGLPETLSISDPQAKLSYLSAVLSKVVLDDIIKRFKPKHPVILDQLVKFLIENIGNVISVTNIHNYLLSQNIEIDINSLVKYIDYIPKTFTLHELNKFDWKSKKVFNSSKKYFAVDTGLTTLCKPLSGNFTKQLENLVMLQLLRNKDLKSLYYGYSANKEIDFISIGKDKAVHKYQVTQNLNQVNIDRELTAFKQDDQFLNQCPNIVLSLDDEETFEYKGSKIQKINLVKWLMGISAL
jgi:predicted AAA+ superfamily ATPase